MFFNLMSIGFPIILDLILISFLIFLTNKNKLIFLNINFVFIITLICLTNINEKNKDKTNYYRGHEKFYESKFFYKKNINETINMPHGDLIAADICINKDTSKNLRVKRTQKFITDKYGFRNSEIDLKDSDLILVGDSQISGSGLSDEFLISNQLNKISNYRSVNLAIGGTGPQDYEKMIEKNFSNIDQDAKLIIFYFEGNDFFIKKKNENLKENFNNFIFLKHKIKSGYQRLERNKDKLFINILDYNNFFYKKIRPKAQRFYFGLFAKWTNDCPVKYEVINDNLVGFYWFKDNPNNSFQTYIIKNPKILKKINKIYFIPTKFSVYQKKIKSFERKKDKFIFLKKSYAEKKIEVVDLTQILQENVNKYLKENEFLYFRDDTHLNQNGTFIIANFINDNL